VSDLVKPFIFIVLGALVPLHTVLIYAPIGIVVSVLFIVCIRPFVVFISLLPWFIERKFNYQDLLFLSFIRETGIIAAVLLVVSATYSLVIPDFLIAVGMWVIFMTLVIEPPLTRQVAQKLGLLKE
jgi:cell volume regulation protein A